MKNPFKTFALGALGLMACSCASNQVEVTPGIPVFSNFTYTGQDAVYDKNPLGADEFYSPILQGCYPDPSICKKGTIITWYAPRSLSIRAYLSSILPTW